MNANTLCKTNVDGLTNSFDSFSVESLDRQYNNPHHTLSFVKNNKENCSLLNPFKYL